MPPETSSDSQKRSRRTPGRDRATAAKGFVSRNGQGPSSEQLERYLFADLKQVVFRYDFANRRLEFISDNTDEVLGIAAEELMKIGGEEIRNSIHPGDGEVIHEAVEQLQRRIRTDPHAGIQYEFRWLKGGRYIWLSVRLRFVYDEDGQPTAGLGIAEDITDTVDSATRPQQRVDWSSSLLEAIPDILFRIGRDLTVLDYKPAAGVEPLVPPAEFLGNPPESWLPPDIAQTVRQLVEEVMRSGNTRTADLELRLRGEDRAYEARFVPFGEEVLAIVRDVTELRRTQDTLSRMERRFQEAINSTRAMMFSYNGYEERYDFISPHASELLGYSVEELMQKSMEEELDDIHPDDRKIMEDIYYRQRENRRGDSFSVNVEYRRRCKDGSYRWLSDWTTFFVDEEGRTARFVGSAYDITDRKQAEQALRASERNRKLVLESIAEVVVYYDRDMKIVWMNDAALKSLDKGPDECVGKRCHMLWYDRDEPCENCPVVRALESGDTTTAEINTPDGRWWQVRGYPLYDEEGVLIGATEVASDITSHKRVQQALELAEYSLERASLPFFWVDENGRFLRVNDQACRHTGYSREELVGMKVNEIDPNYSMEGYRRYWREISEKEQLSLETTHRRKDGTLVPVEIIGNYLEFGGKEFIFASAQDLSQRRQAQQALRQSEERYRIVSQLSSDYAYAFRIYANGMSSLEWMTEAFERVTGYTVKELDKIGWETPVHEDDIAILHERERKVIAGQPVMSEFRIRTKSGDYRWLRDWVQPVWDDEQGRVTRIVGTARDITAQRRAEEELRQAHTKLEKRVRERTQDLTAANLRLQAEIHERRREENARRQSEAQLRALVENLPFNFWAMDLEGRYVMQNANSRAMWGNLTGKTIEDLPLRPDEIEFWRNQHRRAMDGHVVREDFVREEGERWQASNNIIAPVRVDGQTHGILGVSIDITQRKQAEQELREVHQKLLVAGEEERKNLAKELHDTVAQDLVVMQLLLQRSTPAAEPDTPARAALRQGAELCTHLVGEIRRICHGLYPPQLEMLGLREALYALRQRYIAARVDMDVDWRYEPEDVRFDPQLEITLFRIVQESLSNAVRHGKAQWVQVTVRSQDERILMDICDDGRGFSPEEHIPGLGLLSMKDRANTVGGELEIRSLPSGTCIHVETPAREVSGSG